MGGLFLGGQSLQKWHWWAGKVEGKQQQDGVFRQWKMMGWVLEAKEVDLRRLGALTTVLDLLLRWLMVLKMGFKKLVLR